jgi:site-specific DNA-methyltransferase (adenine-specific)
VKKDTRKELSKVASVGEQTIARVKSIEAKANEEVKEKLRTGEVSINQAYQEIKKEEKKANFEQKKAEFEKPIKEVNTNQIILQGDSVEILPTLDENSFDLLLSDPPYGMDFKSGWNNKEKIANDKIQDTTILFENVLKESVPLLKDDAHFYLFGNINFIGKIRPIIEKYLNLKNILIWDRRVIGMGDLKSYGNSYDIIYFGYNKVWKDLNGTRDRDLLSYSRIDPAKNIHPTEKPLDILEYLIKKSSNENDKVLEPFAGGGSTLVACKNTNRQATGIEIEEQYVKLINTRI